MLSIIETNEANGEQNLTDKQKKKFLLDFYRLAFAQESRASGCFHPSEISTELSVCHRKMYFQKGRVPKDKTYVPFTADNRMQRLCDLGTMKHLYVQENLDRAGVLIDMESPVSDPSIGIEGKADGEVYFYGNDDLGQFYDEEMILEVKTINSFAFSKLKRPKPEHVKQASIYGAVLGYRYICFMYYAKDTSDFKIFVWAVDYDYFDDFKYEAEEIVRLFSVNTRIARTTDVTKHTNIPRRVCSNKTIQKATECAYCNFCFKLNT